jgi:hypothetical protein
MHYRSVLPLLALVVAAPALYADGCKFTRNGRFVPEREQRALIEWADGAETLYVAALSDLTTEGSVWVVPVRAPATSIGAEPVDEFPVVGFYESLRTRARRPLDDWLVATAILNSGGLLCPVLSDRWMDSKSTSPGKEVSRVEKLGMVVTVVSAESRLALEEYLESQGIDRRAADLSPLEPYFGHLEFGFVCGWAAQPGEPARATGLKLVFPSPTIWFPLRPTRAYANPVGTVVYVRDLVKPAVGCDLPGLRCEYAYGIVEPRTVSKAFAAAPRYERSSHYADAHFKQGESLLTRVTLTDNPQAWDQDLELVPGATTGGQVSLALTGWVQDVGLGWSALLGALLGLFLPRLTVPRADRIWADYVGGVLTGAAIVLTLWASVLVFAGWRSVRFREGVGPPRRFLWLVALAVVHFLIVLAIYLVLVVGFVRES